MERSDVVGSWRLDRSFVSPTVATFEEEKVAKSLDLMGRSGNKERCLAEAASS